MPVDRIEGSRDGEAGRAGPRPSYYLLALRAFGYPFRGQGKYVLIGGAIMFLVASILSILPVIGLLISGVVGAYVLAYLFQVATDSALGDDEPPNWLLLDFDTDILRPLGKYIAAVGVSAAPAAVAYLAVEESGPILTAAIVFGVLYFPMCLLAVAMRDSLAGVSPHLVIPGIARTFPAYVVAIVLFGVAIWLQFGLAEEIQLPVPLIGSILGSTLGLYCGMVEMRVIGLLYRFYRDRLGWHGVE